MSAALAFLLLTGGDPFALDLRLADLDPETVVLSDGGARDPLAILDGFRDAGAAHTFDVGVFAATTDPRWYGALPEGGDGLPPRLELRRWPGDSVIAFYLLPVGEGDPFPGAFGDPREGPGGWTLREGTIEGTRGPRRALYAEREVLEGTRRCAALLVPGDAGLGPDSVEFREAELLAILARAEVREEAVRRAEAGGPLPLSLPRLPVPPRAWDEGTDPWQTAAGPGFTIGVPPGVHVRRLDTGVAPPRTVPEASMWLRGRFRDRNGTDVVLGDGVRAGWIVEIRGEDLAAWRRGERPPVACPSARPVDRLSLGPDVEPTGAEEGWASSWKEAGFDGMWIVFGLDFGDRGVELSFPMADGRRSLALFWMPLTWRDASRPPAPPPIDPASRFGIRFDPLSRLDRSRKGDLAGTLHAPGVRLDLPRGFWPVATLSSPDGFPVSLVDGEGNTAAVLTRLPAGEPADRILHDPDWVDAGGARVRGAAAIRRRGERTLYLRAHEGHAWILEAVSASRDAWDRLDASFALSRIPKATPPRP